MDRTARAQILRNRPAHPPEKVQVFLFACPGPGLFLLILVPADPLPLPVPGAPGAAETTETAVSQRTPEGRGCGRTWPLAVGGWSDPAGVRGSGGGPMASGSGRRSGSGLVERFGGPGRERGVEGKGW